MAAVTAEPTPAMTTVAAVSMSAASSAHRERRNVSVCCTRTRGPRTCERAHGRAHLGTRRRSCRSGRSSEPAGEGGTHPCDEQGRTLSSARPHGSAVMVTRLEGARHQTRIACARKRTFRPAYAGNGGGGGDGGGDDGGGVGEGGGGGGDGGGEGRVRARATAREGGEEDRSGGEGGGGRPGRRRRWRR